MNKLSSRRSPCHWYVKREVFTKYCLKLIIKSNIFYKQKCNSVILSCLWIMSMNTDDDSYKYCRRWQGLFSAERSSFMPIKPNYTILAALSKMPSLDFAIVNVLFVRHKDTFKALMLLKNTWQILFLEKMQQAANWKV